jgi:RNA polymerase sigma-70 factor (ECF subfamily)
MEAMELQDTRLSLLEQARTGSSPAWQRLIEVYQPFLSGWARRHTNSSQDAEDLAHEILLVLLRSLHRFEHNGRPGAFRSWLRTIAAHTTHDFWSAKQRTPHGTGDTAVLNMLKELEDPSSALTAAWDREHDQFVLKRLLEEVAIEFEPQTMQAFRRLALEGAAADRVAEELNLSVGAIYTAKSRVLQRLRQLSVGLLDWSPENLR